MQLMRAVGVTEARVCVARRMDMGHGAWMGCVSRCARLVQGRCGPVVVLVRGGVRSMIECTMLN